MVTYVIFFTYIIIAAIALAWLLTRLRRNTLNANFVAGLGVAMMALLSIVRDTRLKDDKKIILNARLKKK